MALLETASGQLEWIMIAGIIAVVAVVVCATIFFIAFKEIMAIQMDMPSVGGHTHHQLDQHDNVQSDEYNEVDDESTTVTVPIRQVSWSSNEDVIVSPRDRFTIVYTEAT